MTQTSRRSLSCTPLPRTIGSRCPWLAPARTAPAQRHVTACTPVRPQVPSALCPPVPRCHLLGISPQPAPLGLRLRFHVGVLLASIWWQLFGVAPEEPGQPGLALGQHQRRRPARGRPRAGNRSILLHSATASRLASSSARCCLDARPNGCPQLGGVDPVQPDLVLGRFSASRSVMVSPSCTPTMRPLDGVRTCVRSGD